MTLEELVAAVVGSEQRDWYKIVVGGGSDAHGTIAIFKPDPAVSLAWGITVGDNFKEPWANKFPDPRASSHWADVRLNGSVVFRATYVSVDGARADLPMPDSRESPGAVPEAYARFVRLIHELESAHSFEEYFERASLTRMPRPWPDLNRGET